MFTLLKSLSLWECAGVAQLLCVEYRVSNGRCLSLKLIQNTICTFYQHTITSCLFICMVYVKKTKCNVDLMKWILWPRSVNSHTIDEARDTDWSQCQLDLVIAIQFYNISIQSKHPPHVPHPPSSLCLWWVHNIIYLIMQFLNIEFMEVSFDYSSFKKWILILDI